MRSIGTPVRSDTTIAHVVSCPCPKGVEPLRTRSRPSVEQLDRAELASGCTRGDLDVHRDADAERDRIVRGPAARLLGSQCVVVRGGRDALERLGVVADVVDRADAGRVAIDEAGGTKLRRRTSAGSMPISAAKRSTMRSIATAASGRPAPR